ncbi:MAG: hypothetical protein WDW38_003519 [Sanguina aurantia]
MEGDSTMLHIESPGFLQLVSWLPDDMLLNHVLNALTVSDRSSLRATCKRAQGLANLAVKSVHIPAADVSSSDSLLLRFPCASALRLSDNTQTPLKDQPLTDLLHALQLNRPSIPLHARRSLDAASRQAAASQPHTGTGTDAAPNTRHSARSRHHHQYYAVQSSDEQAAAASPQRRAFRSHTSHLSPRSHHRANAPAAAPRTPTRHAPGLASTASSATFSASDASDDVAGTLSSCSSGSSGSSSSGGGALSSNTPGGLSTADGHGVSEGDSGGPASGVAMASSNRPCPAPPLPFTHLDVKQCHYLTQAGMAAVVRACGKLTHVRPSRWVDTPSLMELSRLASLTHLDLGDDRVDVHSINDASLALISTCMPSLVSLGLSKCVLVTDAGLGQLSSLQGLTELLLPHTRASLSNILPRHAAGAISSAGGAWRPVGGGSVPAFRLQVVDLTGCSGVQDPDLLAAVGSGFLGADLRELRLEGTRVRSAGWAAVAGLLPGVKTLHFGSGFEVNDGCWRALGSARQLRSLTVGNFNLTLAGQPQAANRFQGLRHLKFGGPFASLGMAWVLPLPVLSSLALTGMDAVTDTGISDLVTRQASLESLQLTSGYSLTPAGVSQLQRLPLLRTLTLASCPAVTPAHLRALLVASGSLQAVRLCRGLHLSSGSGSGGSNSNWELSRSDLREEARLLQQG